MRTIILSLFYLLLAGLAVAAPQFPALTGRVVDEAHLLSAGARQSLEQSLAEQETATGNQVVVVTLPSLNGETIESYGYQLGRHWQIGEKGKDNGVLLIVAPKERKVRIEVGYGLEPVLTDAMSSEIIQGIILPSFRAGHMEQGVVDGTQAILSVLGGKGAPINITTGTATSTTLSSFIGLLLLLAFFWFAFHHPWLTAYMLSSSRYGSSRFGNSGFSSGGFGGGFSGGGGSFGGGGASGGW